MRAAVAEAQEARGVVEHLVDRLVIAGDVIHDREEQILVLLDDVVVGDLVGRMVGARGDGGHAAFRARLVIRRVVHGEELVPAAGDELAELGELGDLGFGRFFGENFSPQLRIEQAPPLLLDRKMFERLVGRPHGERIERGADAHHHADGAAGDLRGQRQSVGARRMYRLHQALPALGVLEAIGEQEPDRAAGFFCLLAHPAQLIVLVVEVAVHAEGARAEFAQRRADAEQLVIVGIARGDQLAVGRLVRIRARGGEAEGAGLQRFQRDPPHLGNVVGGGLFAAHGAVAHHIDAHRQMRGLGCDIDDALAAIQRIHEIGEGLPLPGQARRQHRVRDFLDAFHQVHQGLAMMLLHRGKPYAAIAEHHRGHAMPARGRQQRIPHRLAVVMGVHVDPAGGHHQAGGIDVAFGGAELAADRCDLAAFDGDVASEGGFARAVDDGAAANDDVVHASLP
ncbi:hypothetical protein ES707_03526 [subsurface metagenome]